MKRISGMYTNDLEVRIDEDGDVEVGISVGSGDGVGIDSFFIRDVDRFCTELKAAVQELRAEQESDDDDDESDEWTEEDMRRAIREELISVLEERGL